MNAKNGDNSIQNIAKTSVDNCGSKYATTHCFLWCTQWFEKNSNKWKLLENLCLVSGNHLNGAIDNIKKANRFILNSFTK